MEKLKTIIVDDEQNATDVISSIIKRHCPNIQIVALAHSVSDAISQIKKLNPQLVLLDIHLQDGTGFDILKEFIHIDFKIIFVTAYEQYAVKAFKFSALDYILKPINSHELVAAINKAASAIQYNSEAEYTAFTTNYFSKNKDNKKIILKTLDSIYAVSVKEIVRCESDTHYTKFFLVNRQTIMVSSIIKDFEEMLAEYNFFRTHQSHLINLDYFVKYKKADGGFAVLKDGTEVPVATRKKELFLSAISNL